MTQTTPPPSDDDLPDERELAALYARLPKVEPDASLDAAVLAEATRATAIRRRPRWPVALASAAVLVLAVGVAWQVRVVQPETRYASAPVAAPAAPAESIAAEAAPTGSLRVGAASAAMPAQRAQAHRIATRIAPAPMMAPAAPPSPSAPSAPIAPVLAPAPEQYRSVAPAPSGMLLQKLAPSTLGPDDRVGEIRRLLGRGDRAQALRELKDLRQRYPHYDLPQDLRDLNP
jgi:Meckel syndrome type 1 protein